MRFFKKQKDTPDVADLSPSDSSEALSGEVSQKVSLGGLKQKYSESSVSDVDVVDVLDSSIELVDSEEKSPSDAVSRPSFFANLSNKLKFAQKKAAAAVQESAQAGEAEPQPSVDIAQTAPVSSAKKSIFSKFSKSSKTESTPGEGDAPKAVAKPPKKKSKGKSGQCLYLSTEIENGRIIFWELGLETLKQLDSIPDGARVFSFSKDDIRYRAAKSLSDRKAQGVALADIGENVGIVNLSKTFGAIYACRLSKLQVGTHVAAPGVQFFEPEMLSRAPDHDQILGASLVDAESGQSMAILVHVNSVGDAEAAQVSLNPENMSFVLNQFMASRKMNRSKVQTLIFNNQEILELSKDAKAYPSSLMFYGIPLATLQNTLAVGAVVVTAGCLGWAGYQYYTLEEMTKQRSQLASSIEQLTAQRLDVLSKSLGSITKEMSTDVPQFMTKAESFWVPGSKVSAIARQETWEYSVSLPLAGDSLTMNGLSTSVRELDQLQRLTEVAVPDTCIKSNLTSAETQNEFKITISCAIERGRFARIVK